MAMPTSACASAGASLIPSPAIATHLALTLETLHDFGFLRRQHVGFDLDRSHEPGHRFRRGRGCLRSP